jgi:predicted DsbA family dithiol-disulfide isomerase
VGLPGKKVQEIIEQRLYKDAVDKDWNRSYQKGVTAVPTFLMNGMTLVGAQSYNKLAQMVENQGVKKRE